MSYLDRLRFSERATPPTVETVETPPKVGLDSLDSTPPGPFQKTEGAETATDTCRQWAITEADGTAWTSSFTPPATLGEVRARYPGALSVTPCTSATQPAGGALTGTERASVTAALDAMGEDDMEIRAEVLDKCAADPEALAFWTARAPATWDDRRTCRECNHLLKGLCQAAARGELPATARKYRPPRDTLHRCKAFAQRGMPTTTSLPTNEVPPC